MKTAIVTGAGGFIGGHLVARLLVDGYTVRAVDCKPRNEWWQLHRAAVNCVFDLRSHEDAHDALRFAPDSDVYHLAADMGGIGYISTNHAEITRNNAFIDMNVLDASRGHVRRFFFSSSACVYPADAQNCPEVVPLAESDAWPAQPEAGYGLEKLFAEKLCEYYAKDFELDVRVARFHNIYGPFGTYQGGREKAPAALCRKVALASDGGEIELWGDGKQTRSFCYVDDCVDGIVRLMASDCHDPINLGSSHLVSVNELAALVWRISGKHGTVRHVDGPQGVRGRNSDNTLIRKILGWEPSTTLLTGLEKTYGWIRSRTA